MKNPYVISAFILGCGAGLSYWANWGLPFILSVVLVVVFIVAWWALKSVCKWIVKEVAASTNKYHKTAHPILCECYNALPKLIKAAGEHGTPVRDMREAQAALEKGQAFFEKNKG